MIQFNFADRTIQVPTEWAEVTVQHFVTEGFLSGNSLGLISALSDIPLTKLANTTEDLTDKFAKATKFIRDKPDGWQGGPVPAHLELMDVKCKIPLDIEMEMFGQKVMLQDILSEKEFTYQAVPDAIAIYLAPQIFPEDWFDRVPEITAKVLALPIASVYPIATFFLTSFGLSQPDGKLS